MQAAVGAADRISLQTSLPDSGNFAVPPIDLSALALKDNRETLPRSLIETTLTLYFGARLAQRVLAAYGDISDPTVLELKKHLINIAAHVRHEDLEELFEAIRHGRQLHARILANITEEDRRAICQADTFDDLNPDQLTILLRPFRGEADAPLFGTLFPDGIRRDVAEWAQNCEMLRAFERLPTSDNLAEITSNCMNSP